MRKRSMMKEDEEEIVLYCSSEEGSKDQEEQEVKVQLHSYLPGTCQPLYTKEVEEALLRQVENQKEKSARSSKGLTVNNDIKSIAIFSMERMVVFPKTSSIPVRLRNRYWMDYFHSKILLATNTPNLSLLKEELCVGIVGINKQESEEDENEIVGRIGTLCVITHVHNLDDEETSEEHEIVMTLQGFERFCVISKESKEEDQVPIYNVLVLQEESLLPPNELRRKSFPTKILSHITPISSIAWNRYNPIVLVLKVLQIIQTNPRYQGLNHKQLGTKSPTELSYHLSSNLPLSYKEKKSLLECPNVISRLHYLYLLLTEQSSVELRCSTCALPIAKSSNIFSVFGQNTTDTHVNEHGIIHETLTIKEINPKSVEYQNMAPQTKDSWFPGYAWTICYCRLCHSHLGWRFDKVQDEVRDKKNIERFWGFSSGSITNEEASLKEVGRINRLLSLVLRGAGGRNNRILNNEDFLEA